MNVKALVAQLCLALCNLVDCSLPGSSVHGKNTGVGCHGLRLGIFPTQGSNPGLLHCRQVLYCLSHQGNSLVVQWLGLCAFITKELGSVLGPLGCSK